MPRLVLVCVIVIFSHLPASGEELPLNARQRTIWLSTIEQVREICGGTPGQNACTRFVGERLDAGCSASAGTWSMQVKAEYTALMFLRGFEFIAHEHLHLRDIEDAVTTYLVELQRRGFGSLEECQSAAGAAAAQFSAAMRGFAADSNRRLH